MWESYNYYYYFNYALTALIPLYSLVGGTSLKSKRTTPTAVHVSKGNN